MKKRVMIIGAKGVGKSSIASEINKEKRAVSRCPDVIYGKKTIDVPSAYLENTWMYKYLVSISQDASCIIVVVDTRKQDDIYSHGFAKAFSKKVIGVINVIEGEVNHYKDAVKTLKQIGVNEPYFEINLANREGVKELIKFLDLDERG